MNRKKIKQIVIDRAASLRKTIQNYSVQGKMISVKVDCATRNATSFLGINIQFRQSQKLKIFTLAVLEMGVSHTAENLRDKIEEVLLEYGISFDNIYSITCDNAANFMKCGKLIDLSVS